ncbi:DUF397 domain-containing protein [Streptomyces sp. NBC_01197]|uniref:DUF397 domain-containing protein n=1 Tax=Streptomyces sp. NBC_01197 TaxID=2903768 RepID=UPI002E1239AB|nr:DUF397 domain-containing protein [Streptomyces sp. NBC_01197]
MTLLTNQAPYQWVKSSYSNTDGGNCLEWAPSAADGGRVPVRDSKVPAGPVLMLPDSVWGVFVGFAKGSHI